MPEICPVTLDDLLSEEIQTRIHRSDPLRHMAASIHWPFRRTTLLSGWSLVREWGRT